MKKSISLLVAVIVSTAGLNAADQAVAAESAHSIPSGETRIELDIIPGPSWKRIMWFGPIPVSKSPQVAAWVETIEGEFVATLTVTSSTARGKWIGNPEGGRPESLPVWLAASKRKASGRAAAGTTEVGTGGAGTAEVSSTEIGTSEVAPAGTESKNNGIDAVSSPTPKAGLDIERNVGIESGKNYRIFVEVNASFDYNKTWTKKAKPGETGYSGVNGQPSLVYAGSFTGGQKETVELSPIGTGSVDGSTGDITIGTAGLTSALEIINRATATIR